MSSFPKSIGKIFEFTWTGYAAALGVWKQASRAWHSRAEIV